MTQTKDDAGLYERKRVSRSAFNALMAATNLELFRSEALAATKRLCDLPVWQSARTVFAYLSMPRELESDGVVGAAVAGRKVLVLPRTEGDDLSFRICNSAEGPWEKGVFGIREPLATMQVADFRVLPGPVLIVVPGLAFDRSLHRLGRGKGYYDRFLRSIRSMRDDVTAVGFALGIQITSQIPAGSHDENLDLIVHGNGKIGGVFIDSEKPGA